MVQGFSHQQYERKVLCVMLNPTLFSCVFAVSWRSQGIKFNSTPAFAESDYHVLKYPERSPFLLGRSLFLLTRLL